MFYVLREYLVSFRYHPLAVVFPHEKLYRGNNTNVYCKFSRAETQEYIIALLHAPSYPLSFYIILETYNVSFEETGIFRVAFFRVRTQLSHYTFFFHSNSVTSLLICVKYFRSFISRRNRDLR